MQNKKEFYKNITNEIVPIAKDYVSGDVLNQFQSHIEEKLKEYKPTLMVYGVYNAGKSTLLNALFGIEEMAKTGDVPETYEVKDYEYNGFTIYDTPGINVPIEKHEEVTTGHLKKVEMVLFVISNSGSFENRVVYEKLIEVVKSKKPVLIVLNDKNGIGKEDSQIDSQINKINENLNKIATEQGIDDISSVVSIEYINAKLALKGKIKNADILLQQSNILVLEDKIKQMLQNADSSVIENGLKVYIQHFVNDILNDIDNKINNQELKTLQKLSTNFEKLKQRSEVELKNFALESINVITKRFFEAMLSRDTANIEDIAKQSVDEIASNIQRQLQNIVDEIKKDIKDFNIELKNSNIQIDTSFNLQVSQEDNTNNIKQPNKENNNEIILAAGAITPLLPPVVPIGGFPVPVRTIAQVALTLYGLFNGSDEAQAKAEAKLEEKKALHLAAKNRADEFGLNLKTQTLKMLQDDLEIIFNTLFENISLLSQKIDSENKKIVEDKTKLIAIIDKL